MIEMTENEVRSTDGKLLHRIGTEVYRTRMSLIAGDTIESFEEVDEAPPYTEAEYKAKVAELIHERYSVDDEIALTNNLYTAQALADTDEEASQSLIDEYAAYQEYRAECKVRAKEELLIRNEQLEISNEEESEISNE